MAYSAHAEFKIRLQVWLPKLVLSPSLLMILVFVYGFIFFSVYLSFTDSRLLPSFGLDRFRELFKTLAFEPLENIAHQ